MKNKGISLSGYQKVGYQVIRQSGKNSLLIFWYPDTHSLISCYADNHYKNMNTEYV